MGAQIVRVSTQIILISAQIILVSDWDKMWKLFEFHEYFWDPIKILHDS